MTKDNPDIHLNKETQIKKLLGELQAGKAIKLAEQDGWPDAAHKFEAVDLLAARAAFVAERPLLLRGEPGTGKTQFARALAKELNCLLVPVVINGATELEELFWRYDAVARLADAQIMDSSLSAENRSKELNQLRYLIPGKLWWAFNWTSAEAHLQKYCQKRYHKPEWAGATSPQGIILLIDEIDKADPDLPNGLLEAFGQKGFSNPMIEKGGTHRGDIPLLTVITTNEERELPQAFLRRCLVREIKIPSDKESNKAQFNEWFMSRAKIHDMGEKCADTVLEEAADLIRRDRETKSPGDYKPGLAEYLDLLKAVLELYPRDDDEQKEAIKKLGEFVLHKQSTTF